MPATPIETDVVEHEVRVAARPETVFAFFTDPAKMVQWMGAQATLDPRPGGVCRVAFRLPAQVAALQTATYGQGLGSPPPPDPDGFYAAAGEFVEVEPYSRVVFTWGWESEIFAMPPQASAVEVTLTADGEDTVVRLVHRRLPPAAIAFHRDGWEHFLARLATVASGGDPGLDPWQAPE